ncbi:TPA: hypothetical protein DHW58_01525 [Patescibacteria group bacterium]|uniref:Uncharacterized protein n=2 Tax=Bacteria division Kazan-3B-28 TaxID=1798534 RepID=A0A0G1ZGP5_UNCK3|nr:MAG: hypothetical protein VE98_C0001G0397 [candidate division Kazan bacterium GW2011_GWA1_50_15]KKW25913.1 MAG: hypothetical protein VE99_C0001G0552 [candidate division Kazan bacterium GW2011_GWC1_52_13]KKW27072.1 MAG: hypothetical protein VF00_C0001G0007 [candidate division Kazan bacterium GW2011_GWB1_52_7]HAV65928.1 hypothetical protein [Patescibacteria group bacterium]HCL47651.1 hypothetical protein [Patescibacteria group bacterium]
MLITPHFLTGLAIAKGIPEAAPAAIAAVSSHFVLDAVPHRDTIGGHHLNTANILLVAGDGLLALGLWWWLIPESIRWYALTLGLAANAPDFIEIPGLFWPKWNAIPLMKQFHVWHTDVLQYAREPRGWFIGLLPQGLLVGGLIYLLAH